MYQFETGQTERNIVSNAANARGLHPSRFATAEEFVEAMSGVDYGVWPEITENEVYETWIEYTQEIS